MFLNYKKIELQDPHFYKTLPNSFSNKRWVKSYFEAFLGNHILTYPTPRNLSYAWSFRSLAGICLVTQILSGLFLAMHYTPDMSMAFNSVEYIMRDVKNGWLIRYIHSNGASMFFLVVYSHLFRGLYYGSYMRSRRLLWSTGVILYVLMMATAFTGYVLPWGQMSFWGTTVITSFVTALPLIGQPIVHWLWGGYIVSNATLKRFYSIHFVLPFIIAGLTLIHLVLLHKDGSNNPLGSDSVGDEVPFYPYFVIKDLFAFFCFLLIYAYFVLYSPNILSHPDNYIPADPINTPRHVFPEWYFLAFYAILRFIPHKAGGIIAMGGAIVALFTILFLNTSKVRSTTYRPLFKIFYWCFVADFIILSWLGQQPVRDMFVWTVQLATVYYFLFFLVLVPLTGTLEFKLTTININESKPLVNMDAPETKGKLYKKDVLSYIKPTFLTPIFGICIISLFLLIELSPMLSILWLCIATLYFLYMRNYKDISKIWGFTIIVWYLIFTTSLSEVTILIGFENTPVIINYLLDSNFLFENLCFQTVYIVDALSTKLGFSIYIPAVVNIFGFFSKLFKTPKTGCSGKGDSGDKNPSPWFHFGDSMITLVITLLEKFKIVPILGILILVTFLILIIWYCYDKIEFYDLAISFLFLGASISVYFYFYDFSSEKSVLLVVWCLVFFCLLSYKRQKGLSFFLLYFSLYAFYFYSIYNVSISSILLSYLFYLSLFCSYHFYFTLTRRFILRSYSVIKGFFSSYSLVKGVLWVFFIFFPTLINNLFIFLLVFNQLLLLALLSNHIVILFFLILLYIWFSFLAISSYFKLFPKVRKMIVGYFSRRACLHFIEN